MTHAGTKKCQEITFGDVLYRDKMYGDITYKDVSSQYQMGPR
jgi:hypothetical protein